MLHSNLLLLPLPLPPAFLLPGLSPTVAAGPVEPLMVLALVVLLLAAVLQAVALVPVVAAVAPARLLANRWAEA